MRRIGIRAREHEAKLGRNTTAFNIIKSCIKIDFNNIKNWLIIKVNHVSEKKGTTEIFNKRSFCCKDIVLFKHRKKSIKLLNEYSRKQSKKAVKPETTNKDIEQGFLNINPQAMQGNQRLI